MKLSKPSAPLASYSDRAPSCGFRTGAVMMLQLENTALGWNLEDDTCASNRDQMAIPRYQTLMVHCSNSHLKERSTPAPKPLSLSAAISTYPTPIAREDPAGHGSTHTLATQS